MCDRARCNKGVIRARSRLTPRGSQCCGDGAKRPGAITIKRNDVKVCLCLLQVLLTCAALSIIVRDMWAYGQLGQCYRADHRFVRKFGRIGDLAEKDHRGGVQHSSPGSVSHSDGSIRLSMSRRRAYGFTRGRFLRRRISSAGLTLARGKGRSSATGAPSRVTTIRSPCSTRRSTSPPLLRRSRTVTVFTTYKCITGETTHSLATTWSAAPLPRQPAATPIPAGVADLLRWCGDGSDRPAPPR
jgi:hypothetical protein